MQKAAVNFHLSTQQSRVLRFTIGLIVHYKVNSIECAHQLIAFGELSALIRLLFVGSNELQFQETQKKAKVINATIMNRLLSPLALSLSSPFPPIAVSLLVGLALLIATAIPAPIRPLKSRLTATNISWHSLNFYQLNCATVTSLPYLRTSSYVLCTARAVSNRLAAYSLSPPFHN